MQTALSCMIIQRCSWLPILEFIAKFLQFQEVQQKLKELLLNFGLELKKLRDVYIPSVQRRIIYALLSVTCS